MNDPRSLTECFADLPDPRIDRCKRHDLDEILTIALCAVICGADSFVEMERFGHAKLPWLHRLFPTFTGVPSHDTFGRVFAALDPAAFARGFQRWVQTLADLTAGSVVAIDGKTVRRSRERAREQNPVHLVSAWVSANHLALGQVATDAKSNEITAIPALLRVLELHGAIVTIDAMGCQTAIARQIVAGGGDYVLALKANQGTLHDLVVHHFRTTASSDPVRTVEKGHGRIDVRTCRATDDAATIAWLDPQGAWAGLRSIAAITGERRIGEEVTQETRYFVSSLPGNADRLAAVVRAHWGIENGLHWVLDLAFREDECRVRTGHAAENLALVRKLALMQLKRETTAKVGIKARRMMCGWDETYLAKVLSA